MAIFNKLALIITIIIGVFFLGKRKQKIENEKQKTKKIIQEVEDIIQTKKDISKLTRIEKLKRL